MQTIGEMPCLVALAISAVLILPLPTAALSTYKPSSADKDNDNSTTRVLESIHNRDPSFANHSTAVGKRSHSLSPWGTPGRIDSTGSDHRFPWPPLSRMYPSDQSPEAEMSWIRYCYATEAAARKMHDYVVQAIAVFGPAMEYSSLRIGMDYSCTEPQQCICQPTITAPDALHIADEIDTYSDSEKRALHARGKARGGTYASSASTGWRRTELENSGTWEHNRMTIILGKDEVGAMPPARLEEWRQEQVLNIVHELAHVAGLFHEHQRPDATRYIDFRCENVRGYRAARKSIMESKDARFAGLSQDERMQKLCSDWSILQPEPAERVGSEENQAVSEPGLPTQHGSPAGSESFADVVLEFIDVVQDFAPFVGTKPEGPTVPSREYDYLSITHYSSDTNARISKSPSADDNILTLVRTQALEDPPESDPAIEIWQGGSEHIMKRALSVGDIIRIAELYPISQEMTAKAEKLRHTGWQERIVNVGSTTTTVRPAETPVLGKGAHVVEGRAAEQHFALGPWVAVRERREMKPPSWKEVAERDHGVRGNVGGYQFGA